MKNILPKSLMKIILFIAVVIAIEHSVYIVLDWYKSSPMACERIETFEDFIFFVSPKNSDEEAGLSSGQLCVARIRTDDLSGQTHEGVLKNKSGPIEIVLAQLDSDLDAYNYNTDLSLFDIQTASDLKLKLKEEIGYMQGEDIFPEHNKPLKHSSEAFLISFPDENEKYGYKLYFMFYNDKYIRLCRSIARDGSKMNFDFIYAVENNSINIIRNLCQIYLKE